MSNTSESNNRTEKLVTQEDAVIYFIRNLDIDMVGSILDDDKTYQDFKKPVFMRKFGASIQEFIDHGETHLNTYGGHCSSGLCNDFCSGLRFYGEKSGAYMDLIIETDAGKVKDVYECNSFSCDKKVELKNWIRIDK